MKNPAPKRTASGLSLKVDLQKLISDVAALQKGKLSIVLAGIALAAVLAVSETRLYQQNTRLDKFDDRLRAAEVNQGIILANQKTLMETQKEIQDDQAEIKADQAVIKANQEEILKLLRQQQFSQLQPPPQ